MSDKLITMKEYNGSSYDTLYPKNISGQVILDSTALSILNLPANSTVNDGFNHLANGGAFNVGDILVTSRTDMDDTWLLCNGDAASGTEYPDLKNVLTNTPSRYVDIPLPNVYSQATFVAPKLGKSGEILYTGSNYTPCSYNFNTQEQVEVSTSNNIRIADYIPSSNIYIGVYEIGYSTPVRATNAYYNNSLSDLSMNSSYIHCDNYYAGASTTKGQSFIFQKYTSGSASEGFSYYLYKFNDVNDISYITRLDLGSYRGFVYDIGDGRYAFCGGNYVKIVTLSKEIIQSYTLSINANQFASDGTVVIGQDFQKKSYLITASSTTSLGTLPEYVYGSDNHGFFYLSNNKLYNSTDHAQSWNIIDNDVNIGSLYSIVDSPQENKLYVLGSTGTAIYNYANVNIVLPTWSPADGLYAYIKAKK